MDYKDKSKLKRLNCKNYNNGYCNISIKKNGKRNSCSLLFSDNCYDGGNQNNLCDESAMKNKDTKDNVKVPFGDIQDDIDRLKIIIEHLEKKLKQQNII